MKKEIIAVFLGLIISITAYSQENKDRELVIDDYRITATLYHDNGEVSQKGFYNLEGLPDGTWNSYDSSGLLTATAHYTNGQKTGTWYVYSGDQLHEVVYSDNRIAQVITWKNNEKYVADY